LKTLSGEPDVPRKWNRKEALENRGHHYWSVTGVSMECYVRLLTMSRHTTGWQQTRQVSKLLLRYCVGVRVSHMSFIRLVCTIWRLEPPSMQGYSLLSLFDVCPCCCCLWRILCRELYLHLRNSTSSNNNRKTARLTERKRNYETHISAAGHVFAIIISLPRFGMLW